MEESNIYQGVVNTFTSKPKFTFTVPVSWWPEAPAPVITPEPILVKRTWFEKKFMSATLPIATIAPAEPDPIPTKLTFTIYPCKVANMWRLAGAAAKLPDEILDGDLPAVVLPLITAHLVSVIYIVAAGIQNNHEEPAPELITFIERNFDSDDLYSALYPVLENMNMQAFLNSIVLARGTKVILNPKASPTDGSE